MSQRTRTIATTLNTSVTAIGFVAMCVAVGVMAHGLLTITGGYAPCP